MKKITATDVAKYAGVSQSTVSFVLNNRADLSISAKTRSKVMDAARNLGYGPFAENRNASGTNLVAVFVPTFENPFYSTVLGYLCEELDKNNFRPVVFCTEKSEKNETEALLASDNSFYRAIVYLYTPIAQQQACEVAANKKMFIVGETDFEIDASIITLNSKRAGYIAAKYLYGLGHTNMAYISAPMRALSISRKKRWEGMMEFAREAGIEDKIKTVITTDYTNLTSDPESAYIATKRLIANEKSITAIIGMNDFSALGIINALRESQISIPDDVSVMGFDNLEIGNIFYPHLSTIDHLMRERIRHTAELLADGKNSASNIYITYDPQLIVRASTGRVSANKKTTE